MFDPSQPSIAVAFVVDSSGRMLLAWNQKWGCFTIPMTKVDLTVPAETPAQAAVRAAAEVLQVPCRPVAGKSAQFVRGLQKSVRDADIKDYQYNIVPVEAHPDFAAGVSGGVWASIEKVRSGEYEPMSVSVEQILRHCVESGLI
jgi:hypothetical protein